MSYTKKEALRPSLLLMLLTFFKFDALLLNSTRCVIFLFFRLKKVNKITISSFLVTADGYL